MKNMDWLKNNFIAHRGLYTEDQRIPENTKVSYQRALDEGYDIELDVNVLKDGTVVAFHDPNLLRLCHDPRYLKDVTFDDIKNLHILDSDQTIMTLESVLKLVDGKANLLIELKPFGDVKYLCESMMECMKSYQGNFAVFSFHPNVVMWFKKHHPTIIRGQIAEYFKNDKNMNKVMKHLLKTMFFNRFTKPDFISYGIYDLPNKYCDKLMKKGMTVISYAARNQTDFDMVKSHYHNTVFEFFIPKK